MAIPTLVLLGLVIAYPVEEAVRLSFTDYNLVSGDAASQFTGAHNYRRLWHDDVFWHALLNTCIFTAVSVAVGVVVGLALALATENLGGRWRWIRGVLLTSWAMPVIAVSFLFRNMFDENGIINVMLRRLHLVDHGVGWLTTTQWSLVTVILINIWATAPFFLMIFTAGLAAVPNEVLEAARIDKAGVWATVGRIKLPYLRSAGTIGVLIMLIENFNSFPLVWSVTQGGPGHSSTTLVIYVYRLAFTSFDLGYASAIGVVWLVLLLMLSAVFIRTVQRRRA